MYDTKKSNLMDDLRNGVLPLHHVPGLLTLRTLRHTNTAWLFLIIIKKEEFVKGI
jgi:hypothetical protein